MAVNISTNTHVGTDDPIEVVKKKRENHDEYILIELGTPFPYSNIFCSVETARKLAFSILAATHEQLPANDSKKCIKRKGR